MVNLYNGACIDTLCAIKALFIPMYGADIEKVFRKMYIALTGRDCYSDVASIPFEDLRPPVLAVFTPPCPDYAASNPNPQGEHGDKGGSEFVNVPRNVHRARPLVVLIEEVANLINFDKELVQVLLEAGAAG